MRLLRSIESRLAAWYSLLLFAGLLSLGGALWMGVDYSMVTAVDDVLKARLAGLVEYVGVELGGRDPGAVEEGAAGDISGEITQVGPEREWIQVNEIKLYLNERTKLAGAARSADGGSLQVGRLVEALGERADGKWIATEIMIEADIDQELQEDLLDFAVAAPDGELIEIRAADGRPVLPVPGSSYKESAVPWLGTTSDQIDLRTIETSRGSYRVLSGTVDLAGKSHSVQMSSSLAAVGATRSRMLVWLLWSIPAGLVLAFGGGYAVSRAALRPIERVVAVASSMDVSGLDERLDVPTTGDVVERLATTFNAMLVRLQDSVKRLEQFTADASHEFRNPVTVIRTTAELALRQDRSEEELRRDLEQIHGEAKSLTRLIDDLLTLARADSGAAVEAMENVDLCSVARETVEGFQRSTDGRNISAEIGDQCLTVRAHAASLQRLIVILLENAVRHTPDQAWIRVSVRSETDTAVLAVADTGPGIPEAELRRVFDRFYRGDPSRPRSGGGAGLGLAIAKWIAESHGTSITVASEVGSGSTFQVRFRCVE